MKTLLIKMPGGAEVCSFGVHVEYPNRYGAR